MGKVEEGKMIRGGNNGLPKIPPIKPTPDNLRPSNPNSYQELRITLVGEEQDDTTDRGDDYDELKQSLTGENPSRRERMSKLFDRFAGDTEELFIEEFRRLRKDIEKLKSYIMDVKHVDDVHSAGMLDGLDLAKTVIGAYIYPNLKRGPSFDIQMFYDLWENGKHEKANQILHSVEESGTPLDLDADEV